MKWIVGEAHKSHIEQLAIEATLIEITVAFLTEAGTKLIIELARNTHVDLTVSAYMRVTQKEALERLLDKIQNSSRCGPNLRLRIATQRIQGYHGKIYAFHYEDRPTAWIVGSANLTDAGLTGKGDVSLMLQVEVPPFPWTDSYVKQLMVTDWATHGSIDAVSTFLQSYSESTVRGGPLEEDQLKIVQVVGIRPATDEEESFVQEALEAKPSREISKQGNIRSSDNCWLMIINTKADAVRFRTLNAAREGDVLIQGWQKRSSVDASPIKGLIRGYMNGRAVVVAFLDDSRKIDIPSTEPISWRSQIVSREKLPQSLQKHIVTWPTFV